MTERLERIPSGLGMGRSIIEHDERSKNYRAVDLLPMGAFSEPKTKVWRRGQAYNQGMTPMCVAYTGKGVLNTKPESEEVDYYVRSEYDFERFYRGAQDQDQWPGTNYEGSSGLGMCKWMRLQSFIREYRWCFGWWDVVLTVSHRAPVGMGCWWYTGMFTPLNEEGLIRPTGEREGGHEVELFGVDTSDETVIGMNSWGTDWGDRGRFKLSWEDLDKLLQEQGDAFMIIE